jgi:hypothetical protein
VLNLDDLDDDGSPSTSEALANSDSGDVNADAVLRIDDSAGGVSNSPDQDTPVRGDESNEYWWHHPSGVAVRNPPRQMRNFDGSLSTTWDWSDAKAGDGISQKLPELLIEVDSIDALNVGDTYRWMHTETCKVLEVQDQLPDVGGYTCGNTQQRLVDEDVVVVVETNNTTEGTVVVPATQENDATSATTTNPRETENAIESAAAADDDDEAISSAERVGDIIAIDSRPRSMISRLRFTPLGGTRAVESMNPFHHDAESCSIEMSVMQTSAPDDDDSVNPLHVRSNDDRRRRRKGDPTVLWM